MAKSLVENAIIDFRCELHKLKTILGYDDKQLAKYLGCSESTIEKLRWDPMSVSGRYILMVQVHLDQEPRTNDVAYDEEGGALHEYRKSGCNISSVTCGPRKCKSILRNSQG